MNFYFFRIRKRFLLKRLLEVVVGIHVVMSLFQQWMIPSVKNSLTPFSTMDITKITERLLKLAVSNQGRFAEACFIKLDNLKFNFKW